MENEVMKEPSWWSVKPSYSPDQPIEEIRAALRQPLEVAPQYSEDITIRLPHEMIEFLEQRAIEKHHNTLGATIHLMLLEWQGTQQEKAASEQH